MKELELKDGHFYIIKDLFNRIGIANYIVNDRKPMPCTTKHSKEESMILEIYDAISPYFIPQRIENDEANFRFSSDKGDFFEIVEKDSLSKNANIALLYFKKIDSFIEPYSKTIIRKSDKESKKIEYLENETYKSINISPIVFECSSTDNIMEIRDKDVLSADNKIYQNAFKKYSKDAKLKFNERLSKYLNTEYVIAYMQNEEYNMKKRTLKLKK